MPVSTKFKISEKKKKLIEDFNNKPLMIGEEIEILQKTINKNSKNPELEITVTITKLTNNAVYVKSNQYTHNDEVKISKKDILRKYHFLIGANPVKESYSKVRSINFTLDSGLFAIDAFGDKKSSLDKINNIQVLELNWNPYVYDSKEKKQYYQRGFVWNEEDKKNLIDSIYNGIECGRILIRKRGWNELEKMAKKGETELAFKDIVDGKQRLNAVIDFMSGKFSDNEGNYYNDLSDKSQHLFTNHQLFAYSELDENSTDELVIEQFLRLNFCGVPQSKEHIEYIKSISKEL